MSTKNIMIGAAAGGILAGIGFLALHPEGKKLRSKLTDMGMKLAKDAWDIVCTNLTTAKVAEAATGAVGK